MITNTDIILDLYQDNYVVVQTKQYDKNSRQITVTVTSYGEVINIPDSISARVKMKKPDGKGVFCDCPIKDNKIIITETEQMLLVAGRPKVEVVLMENDEIVSSMHFVLAIEASALPNDEIVSSDEYDALTQKLEEVKAWDEYFSTSKGQINEDIAQISESVILTKSYAENSRLSAEEAQGYAEMADIDAKSAAANAESTIVAKDESIIAAENAENLVNQAIELLKSGSLIGPQGIQGPQGEKGEKGDTGPQGIQGEKGEKGDTGESGVVTPVGGFFTLAVDDDGNLWAYSADGTTIPAFDYDSSTGALYYVTEEVA